MRRWLALGVDLYYITEWYVNGVPVTKVPCP